MMTQHASFTTYKLDSQSAVDGHTQSGWPHLLDSLQRIYPSAAIPDLNGLCECCADDGTQIRYGRSANGEFWAVEVISLASSDHWSAFVVPLPDGTSRTGWTRTGLHQHQEPAAWLDCVSHLKLGDKTEAHRPPTFSALIASMSGSQPLSFSQTDQPVIESLTSELDDQRRMLREQANTLRALRHSLDSASSVEAPTAPERKWTLADIGTWASENADRIIVLPRAISETKKSNYADPDLLYAALEILADAYPKVRAGDLPRDELITRCQPLGFFIGGSVEPTRAGEAGNEYFVRWGGRRRFLDMHMGRGNSRDPRRCLRIYFFYDEDIRSIVVGWLPSHLSNSSS